MNNFQKYLNLLCYNGVQLLRDIRCRYEIFAVYVRATSMTDPADSRRLIRLKFVQSCLPYSLDIRSTLYYNYFIHWRKILLPLRTDQEYLQEKIQNLSAACLITYNSNGAHILIPMNACRLQANKLVVPSCSCYKRVMELVFKLSQNNTNSYKAMSSSSLS